MRTLAEKRDQAALARIRQRGYTLNGSQASRDVLQLLEFLDKANARIRELESENAPAPAIPRSKILRRYPNLSVFGATYTKDELVVALVRAYYDQEFIPREDQLLSDLEEHIVNDESED
jgi:hypothetical protein